MQKKDRSKWSGLFFLSLAGGAVERKRIPHRAKEDTEFFFIILFLCELCELCGLCEEFVIFCTTYSF